MFDPSRPFPRKPTLTGDRVILRPFRTRDIDAMGPILADPQVIKLTGSAHHTADTLNQDPTLPGFTRTWYETRTEHADRLDLAVIDRATGACVGETVLNHWDPGNLSCNFRILIGPAGRDRGLGTEATRLTIDHAFTATPLHRLELTVYAFNPRAIHVYETTGFVTEGVRRDALRFDHDHIDAVIMSILRPDWQRDRATRNRRRSSDQPSD